MHARLTLFAPLVLLACSSAPERAPEEARAQQALTAQYAYRVAVEAVPAGSARLELSLRLAGADELHPLAARGLVGNAPFEHSLEAAPFVLQERAVGLAWSADRELCVTTQGRALELELCLARAPASPDELRALEQELASRTEVRVDGQPLAARTARLVRLR